MEKPDKSSLLHVIKTPVSGGGTTGMVCAMVCAA